MYRRFPVSYTHLNVKNYSYTVVDGEVYFRENSVMRPVELNETAKGRIWGLVELRQAVNELIDYQMEDYPEEDIRAKQQEPVSYTHLEKPSVAQALSKVLGATRRGDGYLEGNGYVVSWCVGHLVELAPPEAYGDQYLSLIHI